MSSLSQKCEITSSPDQPYSLRPYQKTGSDGKTDLGKFLGTTIKKITLDTLYELSKKLGWEVPAMKPSEERKSK